MAMSQLPSKDTETAEQARTHSLCQFRTDKSWINLRYHPDGRIMKPEELENELTDPPEAINSNILDRIHGSMIGMALGDALGAHVEFRPRAYMLANPVTDLEGGGTWGLEKGQFTDDTSMALCLANSLVARRDYVPYDQLVRYKWWYQHGYMSSTGSCFDIGSATRQSLVEFERRQKEFAEKYKIPLGDLDYLSDHELIHEFDENCSKKGVAGNGALMRLAPVPLFFYQHHTQAVEYSGLSGEITHGDDKAIDACRYYGALIVAAVNGATKEELVDKNFYKNHEKWFDGKPLHQDIMEISLGSYKKKGGYDKGIRGKGYIVKALEAALWAFWSDKDSFETGVLAAINLGDDTDTTAAIYGQLAGACYGYKKLPKEWVEQVYAKDFIKCLSKWIAYEGSRWKLESPSTSAIPSVTVESPSKVHGASSFKQNTNLNEQLTSQENRKHGSKSIKKEPDAQLDSLSKFEQSIDPNADHIPRRSTFVDSTSTSKPDSNRQPANTRPRSVEHPPRIYSNEKLNSCQDVCKWIRSLSKDYVPYAEIFKEHNVDAYWLLNHINDENLKEYGIERADHRHAILYNIEQLKKQCSVQIVPESK